MRTISAAFIFFLLCNQVYAINTCPNCGEEFPDNYSYCPGCETLFTVEDIPTTPTTNIIEDETLPSTGSDTTEENSSILINNTREYDFIDGVNVSHSGLDLGIRYMTEVSGFQYGLILPRIGSSFALNQDFYFGPFLYGGTYIGGYGTNSVFYGGGLNGELFFPVANSSFQPSASINIGYLNENYEGADYHNIIDINIGMSSIFGTDASFAPYLAIGGNYYISTYNIYGNYYRHTDIRVTFGGGIKSNDW